MNISFEDRLKLVLESELQNTDNMKTITKAFQMRSFFCQIISSKSVILLTPFDFKKEMSKAGLRINIL